MREDIKILEEHLSFIKNFDNGSKYIPALENLIKGYRELEALNKGHEEKIGILEYKYEKALDDFIKTFKNSIPKSLIKETIEELKAEGRIKNRTFPNCGDYIYQDKIDILEELLTPLKNV